MIFNISVTQSLELIIWQTLNRRNGGCSSLRKWIGLIKCCIRFWWCKWVMDGWICTLENIIWFRLLFKISWYAEILHLVQKVSVFRWFRIWQIAAIHADVENFSKNFLFEKAPMLRVRDVWYCTSFMVYGSRVWQFLFELSFSSAIPWLHCLTKHFLVFFLLMVLSAVC